MSQFKLVVASLGAVGVLMIGCASAQIPPESKPASDVDGESVARGSDEGVLSIDTLGKPDAAVAVFQNGTCTSLLNLNDLDASLSIAGNVAVTHSGTQTEFRAGPDVAYLVQVGSTVKRCEWRPGGSDCAPCQVGTALHTVFSPLHSSGFDLATPSDFNSSFALNIDGSGCSGGNVPTALGRCSNRGYQCGDEVLTGVSKRAECLEQCDVTNNPRCEAVVVSAVTCSMAASCR